MPPAILFPYSIPVMGKVWFLTFVLTSLVIQSQFRCISCFNTLLIPPKIKVHNVLKGKHMREADYDKVLQSPKSFVLHFKPNVREMNRSSSTCLRSHLTPPSPKSSTIETRLQNFQPQVYPQRWIQLAYLSLLAMFSDLICFSVSAAPSTFEQVYAGHSAASIIDIFLVTNAVGCLIVSDVVQKFGLGASVKTAGALMTLGCLFRSGWSFLGSSIQTMIGDSSHASNLISSTASSSDTGLMPYWAIVLGTILVGIAQPFFQCTPPALSALWFPSNERATSTAVALNMNQIGIGLAFLIGGVMATSPTGLGQYFTLITFVCALVSTGAFLQFQDKPPIPPSISEMEKILKNEKEPPFLETIQKLFADPAFARPLVAFICSLSITNLIGAFIGEILPRGGVTEQLSINFAGAGFELAILFGGIFIGSYVDRTKNYKSVTLAGLIATICLLIPIGFTNHAIGQVPALLVMALLGLGLSAGPIQPVNAELAVDVTYPTDETAVESSQQIGGNLASALLVPIIEMASRQDFTLFQNNQIFEGDFRGDSFLLIGLCLVTLGFFNSFDSPLLRTKADLTREDVSMNDSVIVDGAVLTVNGLGAVIEENSHLDDAVKIPKVLDER